MKCKETPYKLRCINDWVDIFLFGLTEPLKHDELVYERTAKVNCMSTIIILGSEIPDEKKLSDLVQNFIDNFWFFFSLNENFIAAFVNLFTEILKKQKTKKLWTSLLKGDLTGFIQVIHQNGTESAKSALDNFLRLLDEKVA